jgi:hypothetical protein
MHICMHYHGLGDAVSVLYYHSEDAVVFVYVACTGSLVQYY